MIVELVAVIVVNNVQPGRRVSCLDDRQSVRDLSGGGALPNLSKA